MKKLLHKIKKAIFSAKGKLITFITGVSILGVFDIYVIYAIIRCMVSWLSQPVLEIADAISRPMGFFIQGMIFLGLASVINLAAILPYLLIKRRLKKKREERRENIETETQNSPPEEGRQPQADGAIDL